MAGIEVTTDIDIPKVLRKIDNDEFWLYAASEWHRLYKHYVPYRGGELYNNVTIRPKEIIHNAPYAKEVYTVNKNYRVGQHLYPSCYWDVKAVPTQGQKLVAALQKFVDMGG